MNKIMVTR